MFVQNLSPEQQSVLLSLALEVIQADGELHDSELEMLQLLRAQADSNVVNKIVNLEELNQLFDTEK